MPAKKKTKEAKKPDKKQTTPVVTPPPGENTPKETISEETPPVESPSTATPKVPVEKVEEVSVPEIPQDAPLKVETTPVETTLLAEEDVPLERKNRIFFLAGIIFLSAVLVATILILFFYRKDQKKQASTSVVTTVSPSPVPTVEVSFNPSDWTLEVLNGSGKGGVAKDAANKLSPLGFPIITVGNADKSNYENVHVLLSSNLSKYEKEFMEKIKSVYQNASVSGTLTDSTASARIIVGK